MQFCVVGWVSNAILRVKKLHRHRLTSTTTSPARMGPLWAPHGVILSRQANRWGTLRARFAASVLLESLRGWY